ncbi:MAG: MscS family membrane protein [Saprospiraceae bacterium]|jgi:MscS family membrane protein
MFYIKDYVPSVSNELASSTILSAAFGYVLFLLIVSLISSSIQYFYSRRRGVSLNYKNNVHFGINNIAKLLISIGFIIALFGAWGIDIKSLFTSLSIVAAAIAIISKEFINDFLIGLYFSFSKDFEINDYVKLEEQKGKIIEIGMLKIRLLNDDDDIVVIPNSKIYANEIVNYTKRDLRLMSIDFQMDISKVDNIVLLEQELISSLMSYSEYIEENSYNLKIVEMKKDYIDFKFQYKLRKLDRDMQRDIRKRTVRRIFNFAASKSNQALELPSQE